MKIYRAVLFPGQGSQEPNMGRDIAEASKEAMDIWKKAEKISGLPLRSVYWESEDPALMSDTRYLQPVLTAVNMTIWQRLSMVLSPQCVAGHSLGEFSALAAAKVLTLESTLELVSIRGKIMAESDPEQEGAMVAILRLKEQDVEVIVEDVSRHLEACLVLANYNTPEQFVISGTKKAIEQALPLIKEKRGRAIILPVNGAFHSPFMGEAAQKFSKILSKVTWSTPCCPVYTNSLGKAVRDKDMVYECALHQMTSPVYWINTIIHQWKDGFHDWIEVGPKSVLSRMVAPILESISVTEGFSVTQIGSLDAITDFKETVSG